VEENSLEENENELEGIKELEDETHDIEQK
jgi:hypothetical protein